MVKKTTTNAEMCFDEDSDWSFLERHLESCLEHVAETFANMEPAGENREEVLEDIVETGFSAIVAAMKSDRGRAMFKLYENRVRSSVRRRVSSMMT